MNQVTKTKKIVAVCFILAMCLSLTACGEPFDAKGYTQGCLDALLKGEYENYTSTTGISSEEAQKERDEVLDTMVDTFAQAGSMTDEAQKSSYRELFMNMFSKAKYEVGEAVESGDDSFTVPVTTYKLKVFRGITEDLSDDLENWVKSYVKKNTTAPDQKAIIDKTWELALGILNKKVENPEYGEAQVVNVTVAKTADGSKEVYTISEQDSLNLINACIDMNDVNTPAEEEKEDKDK